MQRHRDVLLELARADKSDLEKALQKICSLAATTLEVARVSYWSMQENNSAIACEVLYLSEATSCDERFKGTRLRFSDCPAYFEALGTKRPIVADRVKFLADLERCGSLRDVECQLRSWRGTVHTIVQSADIIEINRESHMLVIGLDVTQRKQAEAELYRTLAREKHSG